MHWALFRTKARTKTFTCLSSYVLSQARFLQGRIMVMLAISLWCSPWTKQIVLSWLPLRTCSSTVALDRRSRQEISTGDLDNDQRVFRDTYAAGRKPAAQDKT